MNEQLQPLEKAITVWTDGNDPLLIPLTLDGLPQSWVGWTDLELVAADSADEEFVDLVAIVTPQDGGKLLVEFDETALKALLPRTASANKRVMQYVLRARPVGTYRTRLQFGQFTIRKGLGEKRP